MFFIKKIWQNSVDEEVHIQFVRFGKGSFYDRAVIAVKKNSKIRLSSSFELANDLVAFVASLVQKLSIRGIILAKENIRPFGIEGEKKKGLFSFSVEKDTSSDELGLLAQKAYALLLNCEGDGISLKIKQKLPGISASKGLVVNEKFCALSLDSKWWPALKEEFLFGLPEGKRYEIRHTFVIDELILPKGEQDFEHLRLLAKRKGKIIRQASIEGKQFVQEKAFVA